MHQEAGKLSSSKGFSIRQVILCDDQMCLLYFLCYVVVVYQYGGWSLFVGLSLWICLLSLHCRITSVSLSVMDFQVEIGFGQKFLNSIKDCVVVAIG